MRLLYTRVVASHFDILCDCYAMLHPYKQAVCFLIRAPCLACAQALQATCYTSTVPASTLHLLQPAHMASYATTPDAAVNAAVDSSSNNTNDDKYAGSSGELTFFDEPLELQQQPASLIAVAPKQHHQISNSRQQSSADEYSLNDGSSEPAELADLIAKAQRSLHQPRAKITVSLHCAGKSLSSRLRAVCN